MKVQKILILYTNYGTGHFSAAKALQEHLKKDPTKQVEIFDPLSFSRPKTNRLFQLTGKTIATVFRPLRSLFYQKQMYHNLQKTSHFANLCARYFWTKRLQRKLSAINPDIIISTQVGPTGLIATHKSYLNCQLVSVFTDYGLHRWYLQQKENIDEFWVPTDDIRKKLVKNGVPTKRIKITGIPTSPAFYPPSSPRHPNIPTLLFVCGGGNGLKHALPFFKQLLDSNLTFKYIFIAGHNHKLRNKAAKLATMSSKSGKVLGYVDNIAELMRVSDLVLGKPGGLIISEALTANLPFIALAPIPGQEQLNIDFLTSHYFGLSAANSHDFEEILNHLSTILPKCKKQIIDNFKPFKLPY